MAGSVTHAIFITDIYNRLDKKHKDLLKNNISDLRTYGQSHDVFYFSFNKRIKKMAIYAQRNKTQDFFINMIEYINKNKLNNNEYVMSYLFGNICHYCLDYNIHPFIKYKTGVYDKKNKNSFKYRGKHADMESYIDSVLIRERFNISPNKFDIHTYCASITKKDNDLNNLIDYTFYKTYRIKNMSNYYYNSIKNMKIEYLLLRKDNYKIKKKIYNFIDYLTPIKFYKFSPISLAYKKNEKDYYLNLNHKKWNHPMDKNEIYTYSVYDLYNNAINDALKILNDVSEYLDGKDINLKTIFKNISFSTGKDCLLKSKEKYFEY